MTSPNPDHEKQLAQAIEQLQAADPAERTARLADWHSRSPRLADELETVLQTVWELETAIEDWKGAAELLSAESSGGTFEEPLPERIGRYRILEILGAGGMGTVYKAQDPELERLVAVKVPHFELPPHKRAAAVQRFMREARAAARVRHPNICPVHDAGEHGGTPYAVMDYVDGPSLAEVLRYRNPDVPCAVGLIAKVADALDAVHAQGIVHRDLKPGNILLDINNEPQLTDFGLARPLESSAQLTQEGMIVGTPCYMAPEQAAGHNDQISARTDIYSLGVVLYRLLTGALPFEGAPLIVLSKIVNDPPTPPSQWQPNLDPALEAIVMKAIARDPAARYQTTRQFAESLRNWAANGEAPLATEEPALTTSALVDAADQPASLSQQASQQISLLGRTRRQRLQPRWWAIAAGLLLLIGGTYVTRQVIIRITTQDGQTIDIEAPEHSTVEILKGVQQGPKDSARQSRIPATSAGEQAASDSPLDQLDSKTIPAELRSPELPTDVVAVLSGHGDAVFSVAFTPDGRRLVTSGGAKDPTVRVWDVVSGKEIHRFQRHKGIVLTVAISPDGRYVISGDTEKTACFWELETGREICKLGEQYGSVFDVAFSPDGRLALAGTNDGFMRLWDIETRKEIRRFGEHYSGVLSVAFSPDGRHLASGNGNTIVSFWDVNDSDEPLLSSSFGETEGWVYSLAFSPDGRHLLSSSGNGTVQRWNVTGEQFKKRTFARRHDRSVSSISVAPDGKTLATAGLDNRVILWDVATTDKLREWKLAGKYSGEWHELVNCVAFAPDGRHLAAGNADGNVYIFRLTGPASSEVERAQPGEETSSEKD